MSETTKDKDKDKDQDRKLGMARDITRRDFLNGVGIAIGTSLAGQNAAWAETFGVPGPPVPAEKSSEYYPPSKTGMRGSHDGSFEVAHDLRDGNDSAWAAPVEDAESHDLIVVGAGISGLY